MSANWAGTPSLRRKTCFATCANWFWSFLLTEATKIWFLEDISRFSDEKPGIAATSNWFGQNPSDLVKICQIPVPDLKSHLEWLDPCSVLPRVKYGFGRLSAFVLLSAIYLYVYYVPRWQLTQGFIQNYSESAKPKVDPWVTKSCRPMIFCFEKSQRMVWATCIANACLYFI